MTLTTRSTPHPAHRHRLTTPARDATSVTMKAAERANSRYVLLTAAWRRLAGGFARLAAALLAACWVLFPLSVSGEDAQHPAQHDAVSQHHRVQYLLMKDMAKEMAAMADEMAAEGRTAQQDKDMARRMDRMSVLMHRMSGLASKPAMSDPQMAREMEQMRREMDVMLREHPQRDGQ